MSKKTIAVVFGGRSVEHDVSILTGLQFIEALDPTKYDGLPVYVDSLGQWWTGNALRKRSNYPVDASNTSELTRLELDLSSVAANGQARFMTKKKGMLGVKEEEIPFDLIVPAIHGSNGEDGSLQGLLDFAGIPYAGCRTLGASATMNKPFTKDVARSLGVKVLPDCIVTRPDKGTFLDPEDLTKKLNSAMKGWDFPLIVKPCNLGSSVGVGKADTIDELIAALMTAFRMDNTAIIEPFVDNLTEYNVAVRRDSGEGTVTSAIEEPKREADLLDFKNKYLAGGSPGGPKLDTTPSEGMASLNRTLNPDTLSDDQETFIRSSATSLFNKLDLAGSVRIDYLCNAETGEIWFNEVNTIPGSFAYFLWEAAENPLSFLKLTDAIISEGFAVSNSRLGKTDTSTGGANIF